MHKIAKELLANQLTETEKRSGDFCTFGTLSWRVNCGVFTELKFHENDDPYYFELSKGLDQKKIRKIF